MKDWGRLRHILAYIMILTMIVSVSIVFSVICGMFMGIAAGERAFSAMCFVVGTPAALYTLYSSFCVLMAYRGDSSEGRIIEANGYGILTEDGRHYILRGVYLGVVPNAPCKFVVYKGGAWLIRLGR